MQRVDTSTAVAEMPAQNEEGTPGYFSQGNPAVGQAATVPGQDWFNAVQEEIIKVIIDAGLSPEKTDLTQLSQAITLLAKAETAPVGTPLLWFTETPPNGYLECDGASLSRAAYANLFAILGTLYGAADGTHFNLPDIRGRFLRVWAHGSANDPDRATRTVPGATGATITAGDHVGTDQEDAFESHTHSIDDETAFAMGGGGGTSRSGTKQTGATGGNETRPVNTAVMLCIKY